MSAVVPFGAGANQLAKTQSLPSLHRSKNLGDRGVLGRIGGRATLGQTLGGGDASPWSPKAAGSAVRSTSLTKWAPPTSPTSPMSPMSPSSPQAMMSATWGAGGQVWSGRMAAAGYWGTGPPKSGVYKKVVPPGVFKLQHVFEADTTPATAFRRHFERGDLPITKKHGAIPGVEWKVEPERLDYVQNLPIFFDGLLEKAEPFATMAYSGLQDMLNAARGKQPSLLGPAVPMIIVPLRRALNTRDNSIMCKAINMLQLMIRNDPSIGELFVPYYRQLLTTFNLYKANNANLGDGIDYAQRKRENMGDLVAETLELFERTGGEDAFINIKYMIPTYESCML